MARSLLAPSPHSPFRAEAAISVFSFLSSLPPLLQAAWFIGATIAILSSRLGRRRDQGGKGCAAAKMKVEGLERILF